MPGRPVLVGYDGSEAAQLALAYAAERCADRGRKLLLVNVVPRNLQRSFSAMILPSIDLTKVVNVDKFRDVAVRRLEEVAEGVRESGVEVEAVVRDGDTADELLAAAREADAEMIVLGYMSYEHSLPYGVGSVAEKVMRYADRSVAVIRPPGAGPRGQPVEPPAGAGKAPARGAKAARRPPKDTKP